MRRAKKLYTLLGVLALVCIAAFAVSRYERKKEEIRTSDEIILTLDADSAVKLSWSYEDVSLSFHKDTSWIYDDDETFPVNEEKITQLLNVFQNFGVSFKIENVEDYAQYGLDDPVCTIYIGEKDTGYEIILGSYSTMDEKRYVSIGDGNVYLAASDPFEDYEVVLSDMILNDTIPDLSDAESISFSGTENYTINREEDSSKSYCPDDIYFTNGKPLDTSLVSSYLSSITKLSLSNYVSYNATDDELEAYGLSKPELTVKVNYPLETETGETETRTFDLHIGRNQEELNEAQKNTDEDAFENVTAYVRVGDSGIIYTISYTGYCTLTAASYDDLRHKEVLTAPFDDINQIDIKLEGNNYTFTAQPSDDSEDERIWIDAEGNEVDINSLQSKIEQLTADSFTDIVPEGKEEIRFTVHLDNETYPEVSVQLYRYDGIYCIAVVNGTPVSMVTRSSVVALIEAVNSIVLN